MINRTAKYHRLIIRSSMLAACLFLLLTRPLMSAEIDIKADSMEYDEVEKFMVARGSVVVTWEEKVLKAENVKFWADQDRMYADTNVVFVQKKDMMICDGMDYNFGASTGVFMNTSGIMKPWFFHAKELASEDEKRMSAKSIKMTTCDRPTPHYYIRATRAKIRVGEKITVYNPVFYTGGVPVFYLPLYMSSLKGSKLSVEVNPGYNSEDGLILKTIVGYPLTENSYGKLYIDYFQKRGWGKGAEYNYFLPNKLKGTVYGYHIKENTTGSERWSARGSYWQKINPLWTGQFDMNFMSDSSLNSLYLLDNWQRKNQQLNSYLAFTRQSSRSNLRISTERQDNYDNVVSSGFVMTRLTLPRIEYTLFTSRGKLPFYTNFSASVQNQYTKSNDYYLITANADYNISKDLRLGRKTVFTPKLGISEYWVDRTSSTNFDYFFITRYYNDLNIRHRLLRWIDWDLGYNYKVRTEKNKLLPETEAADYGEETKQVYFRNYMYLRRNLSLRNSSSYDFRVSRGEVIDSWAKKLNPLVNELTWVPARSMSVYLREDSVFYPNHYLKSFQALSQIGMPETKYFNFGFFYNADLPGQYDFSLGFGFWPTDKWKLDYSVKTSALNSFVDFRTTFYEIKVYRDLHCWETGVTYRRVAEVTEVYLQIGLKVTAEARNKINKKQQEKEFYPWR